MLKTHTPGPRKGADFLAHVDPHQLKAQGVELVGIYLKNTTKELIKGYHDAGISVFLIHQRGYEGKGPTPAAAGTAAGLEAATQAKALGYPTTLPIVFASMGDYDNTTTTLSGSVAYFLAASAALKSGGYLSAGAYGDRELLDAIGIRSDLGCQAAAKGWSWFLGKWRGLSAYTHIEQLPSRAVAVPVKGWPGVRVDPLNIIKPIKAWGPGPDVIPVRVAKPILRRTIIKTPNPEVALLQRHLKFLKLYSATVDGKYGPVTQESVKRLQSLLKRSITGTYDVATAAALSKYLTDLRELAK